MNRARWKLVFFVASLAFMLWLLGQQWSQVRGLNLVVRPTLLAAAVAALVGLFFLDALGWHLILRVLGTQPRAAASIRTWLLSSLARYLPGGVWGFVSRAALCNEQGIPLATTTLALYLETLMLCAASFAVGLPALIAASGLPVDLRTALLLWLLLGLLMHPRVLALLRYLPGRAGRVFAASPLPTPLQVLGLYLYYVVFWAIFGAVFVCFVVALSPLPDDRWLPVAASMGLSFAIGFVAVFAPGGIGVRESAVYLLLLPHLPAATCLLIAVTSRLWIMSGEAISVALALTLISPPPARLAPGNDG